MSDKLSKGQQQYEQRRAAKAGLSLDRWLEDKRRQQEAVAREEVQRQRTQVPTKPGLLSRLLDRAHRPLGGGAAASRDVSRKGAAGSETGMPAPAPGRRQGMRRIPGGKG